MMQVKNWTDIQIGSRVYIWLNEETGQILEGTVMRILRNKAKVQFDDGGVSVLPFYHLYLVTWS